MSHTEELAEQQLNMEGELPVDALVKKLRYELREGERPLSCCVDGRMVEDQELAPAARPGADAGDFMTGLAALRKLGVNNAELRDAVFEAAVRTAGGPERFRFHTDEHAVHDLEGESAEKSVGRGCGHLKQAEKSPEAYGLTLDDMNAIFERLVALRTEGAKEVVLRGAHGERAVVVVDSEKLGLRHGDGNGLQAFVYQAALDQKRVADFGRELATLPQLVQLGLSEEAIRGALLVASDQQRQETLKRLAKGLPIFVVNGEGESVPSGQVSS